MGKAARNTSVNITIDIYEVGQRHKSRSKLMNTTEMELQNWKMMGVTGKKKNKKTWVCLSNNLGRFYIWKRVNASVFFC